MASQVDILNAALLKLGAEPILSPTDDNERARLVLASYNRQLSVELRAHPWRCAIKRVVLAADTAAPAFDEEYQYTLPADCLRVLFPRDTTLDWVVEGRKILTYVSGSINLRYVGLITDLSVMDALLAEALACRIAMECCERITNSSPKGQLMAQQYQMALREARRLNALEKLPEEPAGDPWLSAWQ